MKVIKSKLKIVSTKKTEFMCEPCYFYNFRNGKSLCNKGDMCDLTYNKHYISIDINKILNGL